MRTEVISKPPPKRLQTTVLRAGPPKGRRPFWDNVFGILGAILLIAAVVMVSALPEKDVLIPQFEVSITDVTEESFIDGVRTQTHEFSESDRDYTFVYSIPTDNVHTIVIDMSFTDENAPASLPDEFKIWLEDPLGRTVETEIVVRNEPPIYDEQNVTYHAGLGTARLSRTTGLRPESEIQAGIGPEDTAEAVRDRFISAFHTPTTGEWKLHVQLVVAGDCPNPANGAIDPLTLLNVDPVRVQQCHLDNTDGQDTMNNFTVERFQYTYFEPEVSEL